jgi:hypothetical protein
MPGLTAARRATQALVVVTLAWGLFAFGATYLWASRPLMAGCVLAGAGAWILSRRAGVKVPLLPIGLMLAAIGLQLVPWPAGVVTAVSPNALAVVAQRDLLYAMQRGAHAFSIAPAETWQGLWLFLSFSVLLAGLTKFLSDTGTRWLIGSLAIMGAVLALVGIAQKALGDGIRIYGFWTPQNPGNPFGPFVNRNHFAGWMLMALPLTVAFGYGHLARALRHVKPDVRHRLIWLGSTEGSQLLLTGAAAMVMGLALVMTMSRSGIAAFGLGVAVIGAFAVRGMSARAGRSSAWLFLAVLIALVIAWVGVDAVIERFAGTTWSDLEMRRGAWADARDIASRFVLTGTGLNTYGVATLFFQQHDLAQHYAQAHNDYLQLWAEGGLLLTIPAVLLAVAMARAIRRRFLEDEPQSPAWWARAGAVTGLLSVALQELVDFSLQMPGNAALFTVLCAIALHKPPRAPDRSA